MEQKRQYYDWTVDCPISKSTNKVRKEKKQDTGWLNRIRPVYDLLSSDDDFVTSPSKAGKTKMYSTRREKRFVRT